MSLGFRSSLRWRRGRRSLRLNQGGPDALRRSTPPVTEEYSKHQAKDDADTIGEENQTAVASVFLAAT